MQIEYSQTFVKQIRKLPKEIVQKAIIQEDIFKQNQEDKRLHTKKLKGKLKGVLSFRITRNYRILYTWKNKKTVLFYEIGDRKFIYK